MSTLQRQKSRLPRPLSSFIGREDDIQAVCELFLSGARLVTLTGPGGVGKTRLAIAVAEKLSAGYEGDVVFVSLAPLADDDLVVPTIARTLDVEESMDQPIVDRVVDYLESYPTALVLDNVEHLLGAAPEIAMLLQACPALIVLATGREPLNLQGERIFEVRSLGLPNERGTRSKPPNGESPAVRLFADRAGQAMRDFTVTDENRTAVHEICRRVDGLPLALELAAARMKTLSPDDLLCRLDQPLAVLTGGPRDAPDRQRTMRATLQWSYDLLNPDEQRLLCCMSVFAGGGTLEAIEAVSPGDSTLDALSSLVDKSLARRIEDPDGRTRYDLLVPVRQFAYEQLRLDTRDVDTVRKRHAKYCRLTVDELRHRVDESDAPAYLDRIEREHDNIRAALNWCRESDQIELGLDIVGEVGMFWVLRSYVHEGLAIADSFLAHPCADAPTEARVKALWVSVWMHFRLGDRGRPLELAEESYAIACQIGFDEFVAHGLFDRGICYRQRGDIQKTVVLWKEALEIFRRLDDRAMVVRILTNWGQIATSDGDLEHARELLEEALRIGRTDDLKISTALALGAAANASLESGDPAGAWRHRRDQMTLYAELKHHEGIANNLRGVAVLCRLRNQPEAAVRLLSAGVALHERLGLTYHTFRHARDVGEEFEKLRIVLPEAVFDAARAAGGAMTMEEAAAYALEVLSENGATCDPSPPDGLTPRETEVLSLIAAGRSNRQMAEDLYLSIRTVERHVANIYRKIDVHNRAEAARYALEHGLAAAPTT